MNLKILTHEVVEPNIKILITSWQENAIVIHAIIGWKSSLGKWSRVQASLITVVICEHHIVT